MKDLKWNLEKAGSYETLCVNNAGCMCVQYLIVLFLSYVITITYSESKLCSILSWHWCQDWSSICSLAVIHMDNPENLHNNTSSCRNWRQYHKGIVITFCWTVDSPLNEHLSNMTCRHHPLCHVFHMLDMTHEWYVSNTNLTHALFLGDEFDWCQTWALLMSWNLDTCPMKKTS